MQEYQALGFLMTSLHNFATRYEVPILAFTQLNRDGITKESTDVASGSDRILWLCSNFSIYKEKSDEEIAEGGGDIEFDRKLITLVARHGPAMKQGNYINMNMLGWCSKITEGQTRFQTEKNKKKEDGGFVVENGDQDIPFE